MPRSEVAVLIVEAGNQVDTGSGKGGEDPAKRVDEGSDDPPGDGMPCGVSTIGVLGFGWGHKRRPFGRGSGLEGGVARTGGVIVV